MSFYEVLLEMNTDPFPVYATPMIPLTGLFMAERIISIFFFFKISFHISNKNMVTYLTGLLLTHGVYGRVLFEQSL